MKLRQISVFLENQPGRLTKPCAALARAGLNIFTIALADTQNFGILRIIVQDWKKACKVLEKSGAVIKTSEVIAIKVPDSPGGLSDILRVIEQAGINIDYMYACTTKRGKNNIIILRFDQVDKAVRILKKSGIGMVAKESIFAR